MNKPAGKLGKERRQTERKPYKTDDDRKPIAKNIIKQEKTEIKEVNNAYEDIPRLEGRNPVLEALKSGRTIEKLYVAKGSLEGSIKQIISMAREKGIVINEIDRVKMDAMSETRSHQGVIANVSPYTYVEVEDILNFAAERNEKPFIVILDEIYDPHNLGSIIRTADASGVHGIIISKRRAVGLTPAVAKASAGAIEYAKVAKVTNISQTIRQLKDKGVWIVGTDADGEKSYYESDLTGPIALVVGSEGEGMGKLVKESCDFIVNLPMKGNISSLNAGVAGAIVMYEILRQRILKG
ncbi:23S rRNA (guanosine(2251)-2'-O)-methyltransferase RlmB [Oxobacter pfennigii]